MIEVQGFSKVYERQLAVDDLHFEVRPGEILGLVGPNGAGKTTTLMALAGILPPTSGTLSIAGFDVVKEPIESKSRLSIIPDQPNLFESLTVWEHLEFTAKVYGVRNWRARGGASDRGGTRRAARQAGRSTLARHAPEGGALLCLSS